MTKRTIAALKKKKITNDDSLIIYYGKAGAYPVRAFFPDCQEAPAERI